MPVKIQPTYTAVKPFRISAMGDSLTHNYVWGVSGDKYYPAVLQGYLNTLGAKVLVRNFGISGQATGQMVGRINVMTQYEVPDIAIIYAGTNDLSTNGTTLVTNATTATTTQFSVTVGSGVRFPAGSYIKIGSDIVRITAQVVDLLTVTPALSGAPSVGDTVNCATQQNLIVMGQYLQSAGCNKIVIVGRHYDNFSSGGDTTGTPLAANAALRTLQQAAATALNVPYCNLYSYMSNLITTSVDIQGSFSWHVFNNNIHLNTYGEKVVADALLQTIQAQTSWLASIS